MNKINYNFRHGHSPDGRTSGTYNSWRGMIDRCTNPNHKNYVDYAGKGIIVCERWLTFTNFLSDMGVRPDGKTLDRYPNKAGNYEPGNCRWATYREQARNTRRNVLISHNSVTQNLIDWARAMSMDSGQLSTRIQRYGVEKALDPTFRRRKVASK